MSLFKGGIYCNEALIMLQNYFKFRRIKNFLLFLGSVVVILLLIYSFKEKSHETFQKTYSSKSLPIQNKKSVVNYDIHIFYYIWYGNKEVDKQWIHWNHKKLPHWNKVLMHSYSTGDHVPPLDIGSDFYPTLGLYSSRSFKTIGKHMKMISEIGVGTIVISWYPSNMSDPNGKPVDDLIMTYLSKAHNYKLKIALHIEPYKGRSVESVKKDILYITNKYGKHPAYYKRKRYQPKYGKDGKLIKNKEVPVIFVYDSYLITINDWNKLLTSSGAFSIRNNPEDCFVIGLILYTDGCEKMSIAGFDGAYSYFGGEKVSIASKQSNWPSIQSSCLENNIRFFPSISPGYIDEAVRPWNSQSTEDRNNGEFYKSAFKSVLKAAQLSKSWHGFGITSFNEWHEGTQIEPASPFIPTNMIDTDSNIQSAQRVYQDYGEKGPNFYLDLTRKFVFKYINHI